MHTNATIFDRIVSDPGILGGKPCVRGTRISVEFLLELLASGANQPDILANYPQLVPPDIEQALRYAALFLQNETFISAESPS